MSLCKKCGVTTHGYKCDMCSLESASPEPSHACGPRHMMPKCSTCGKAEVLCGCSTKRRS